MQSFEEEINFKSKWDLIPPFVHEAFLCDMAASDLDLMGDNHILISKGIVYYVDQPEAIEGYELAFFKWWAEAEDAIKLIWNRHYADYGFPFIKGRV